ncbi:MAG TPA: hypothetical protein VNG51_27175 [Ktedonobacteraceae bacterium]|nr:hypothetical protein [Ktedonobacteraceae bacterium]
MSEGARIRRQIELECEAMNLALYGYASVASHKIIEQKYNNLGHHRENLEKHVGKVEAGNILIEIYTKVIG